MQTADARVLAKGTGYVTDVGFVGPRDSVIGSDPDPVIRRHLTQMFHRMDTAKGPVIFSAVLVDLDASGRCTAIRTLNEEVA